MRNRHEHFRDSAGRAVPLLALRCAALLAVLMRVLPVCTHTSPGARLPAPVVSGFAVTGAGRRVQGREAA
ncbi:hypothetical protein ABZ490_22760 [Streptomyces sp. NPDC005811]|uniref:hypothetical protein n=1 Tax=Streptomyces sp. NPDC005811 TaxID=3154565 RepID=UPI0033F8F039